MRGLFYRHRRWQKLNLTLLVLALMLAFFFHAVLNTIAQSVNESATSTGFYPDLEQTIANGDIFLLFTSSQLWTAQFSGFFSVFTYPTLWLSWLWLPLTIAVLLVIQALSALTNQPRWQTSTLILLLACLAAWGLPVIVDVFSSAQALAIPAQVGLYCSLSAAWVSAVRLRSHHSH